jgi:hypothetical protein
VLLELAGLNLRQVESFQLRAPFFVNDSPPQPHSVKAQG